MSTILSFSTLASTGLLSDIANSDDSTVEADVSISVKAADDQATEQVAADAEHDASSAIDSSAALFANIDRLYGVKQIADTKKMSTGLYSLLNSNKEFDTILGRPMASFESLSPTSDNADIAASMSEGLGTLFSKYDANLKRSFGSISTSVADQATTLKAAVAYRIARMEELVEQVEAEETPEEIEVTTVDAPETVVPEEGVAEPAAEPVVAPSTVITEPIGDDKVAEIETSVDVNTPEETAEAVEALGWPNLVNTPIIAQLNAAVSGGSFAEINKFIDTCKVASMSTSKSATTRRTFKVSKASYLEACKKYLVTLKSDAGIQNLLIATGNCANMAASEGSVATYESFQQTQHLMAVLDVSSRYVSLSKKILDCAYHNLKFLGSKFVAVSRKK